MSALFSSRLLALSQSRYFILWAIFISALVTFAATRTILAFISPDSSELSALSIIRIYGIGVIYDAAFFAYALIPVSLYLLLMPNRLWRSRLNRLFVHLTCFAAVYGLLFIIVAEILFWLEFSVRFNFISVDYLVYRREVTNNIAESYPLILILSAIFFMAAIIYWKLFPHVRKATHQEESFRRRALITSLLWLLPLSAYAGIDQNIMHTSANNYQNELSGNGPYQFFAAFRNNELDYYQFYTTMDDKLASSVLRDEVRENNSEFLDNKQFDIKRSIHAAGKTEKHLNIVLVMVESLSADFLGIFGNQKGLTPNLDSLAQDSLLFERLYATGTRTTRGLEAVTLSIPPTPGRSIVKRLGNESNMWSLGNVLQQKGYETRFIYGGRGYFDNMNAFFSGNGYGIIDQSSVAEEEIGFENAWGMADEYLYNQAIKTADTIHQQGKPFFFHLMTTSNHRPYSYPENRIDIPSGSGRDGAVKYTDWAIGDFLQQARNKPWFNDTVFVIVADHTSGSAGKSTLPVNNYHIPMMFYSPANIPAGRINKIVSQIDIAPTLLAMLDMNYVSNFFGKNIFSMRADEERALIGNYQHLGLYKQGLLSIISPQQKLTLQIEPESGDPVIVNAPRDDPFMLRNMVYYQGASYTYSHHLNAWNTTQDPRTIALK